jgi:hypothetical protein
LNRVPAKPVSVQEIVDSAEGDIRVVVEPGSANQQKEKDGKAANENDARGLPRIRRFDARDRHVLTVRG